jgi:predicted nucleic acid-binding protein
MPDVVVLDTNVVSYLMKGHDLARLYRQHLEGKTLAVSFMTVAELYEGAYRRAWGKRKLAGLEAEIRKYLVIPYSPRTCRVWGQIRAARKARTIAVDDAWIAATAVAFKCPLVTHNPKDFEDVEDLCVITEPGNTKGG